jgi:hypothetical protein
LEKIYIISATNNSEKETSQKREVFIFIRGKDRTKTNLKKRGYNNKKGKGAFIVDERMGKENVVSFAEFLHELQKELKFHQDGGTSYRQQTAKLSLEVARKVGSVVTFLDSEIAKQTVSHLFSGIDCYRVEDVAKMLHTIARELHMNATLYDEVKAYVQQKRHHLKPLSFVKNKRAEN